MFGPVLGVTLISVWGGVGVAAEPVGCDRVWAEHSSLASYHNGGGAEGDIQKSKTTRQGSFGVEVGDGDFFDCKRRTKQGKKKKKKITKFAYLHDCFLMASTSFFEHPQSDRHLNNCFTNIFFFQ